MVKTDELIIRLANDLEPRWSLRPIYGLGLLAGALIAFGLFAPTLGVRPDIGEALRTLRFDVKLLLAVALATAATGVLFPLSRPGASTGRWAWFLAAVPCLLGAAVVVELVATPPGTWGARLVGHNALVCLVSIPLLAAGPLACLFVGLRRAAPTDPGLAGAVAGLAASGLGASFYAVHCPDDSPLFVMTWYVLATLLVAAVGFVAGRRLLTW